MASITIRNLDDRVKTRLRMRAAEHGRSMEEEARCILRDVLAQQPPLTLADLAAEIFGCRHGVELDIPRPPEPRKPPDFK